MRYGIGVGREGFTWSGEQAVARKSEWPDWRPPADMLSRQPYLPRFMAGGPGNPLGARAISYHRTATGKEVDFVSRFFAPRAGVDEDPVTGSAHSTLVPYWAKRLNRPALHALQVSHRGGELWCEDRGKRVIIKGSSVKYLEGFMEV